MFFQSISVSKQCVPCSADEPRTVGWGPGPPALYSKLEESPVFYCFYPAKHIEQGYHPCCLSLLLKSLEVREDQKICSRNPYHLDRCYFMAIFIFWVGWDQDSCLEKELPASLLPLSFPGHWAQHLQHSLIFPQDHDGHFWHRSITCALDHAVLW